MAATIPAHLNRRRLQFSWIQISTKPPYCNQEILCSNRPADSGYYKWCFILQTCRTSRHRDIAGIVTLNRIISESRKDGSGKCTHRSCPRRNERVRRWGSDWIVPRGSAGPPPREVENRRDDDTRRWQPAPTIFETAVVRREPSFPPESWLRTRVTTKEAAVRGEIASRCRRHGTPSPVRDASVRPTLTSSEADLRGRCALTRRDARARSSTRDGHHADSPRVSAIRTSTTPIQRELLRTAVIVR